MHTYGHPARIDRIVDIARRNNRVVEDAAEALGARAFGRAIGSFGDLAIFSFYANKVLTTGEGGMVVTNDLRLCERLRAKRNLCFGADEETRYVHHEIGFNYRMTNLQAAMGIVQLQHLNEAVQAKIAIAREYNVLLADVPGITTPPDSEWGPNVFWVYAVLIEDEFGLDRKAVQSELRRNGSKRVGSFILYIGNQSCQRRTLDRLFPNHATSPKEGYTSPRSLAWTPQQ